MNESFAISAVVILYNPPDNVLENIKSYYDFVDRIYVFDNSQQACKEDWSELERIEYYHDSINEGIARRLNTALDLAGKQGANWLLTMDQDTRFSAQQISSYFDCIRRFKEQEKVALFGTAYSNKADQVATGCSFKNADNLITSGMVVNLKAATVIGRFDENLFIDSIDHDYVIRSLAAGYRAIKFSNIHIEHHLGEEVKRASIKTLFLVKKKKIIHSPLRSYYMYRNMLYLENKFKDYPFYLAKNLRKIVTGNLLANVFYGRNFLSTIKFLIKARKDYRNNRMGKIRI